MMRPGKRHWLAVLIIAVLVHAALLIGWRHADTTALAGQGGTPASASVPGIRIALTTAPADEDISETPPPEQEQEQEQEPEQEPEQQAPEQEPEPEDQPEPEPEPESKPTPEPEQTQTPVATPDTSSRARHKPRPKHHHKPRNPPVTKHKTRPKPEPKPEPKPKPDEPAPAPDASDQATADTTQDTTPQTGRQDNDSAAATSTQSSGSPGNAGTPGRVGDTPPSYQQKLRAWLARHKTYPRRARRLGLEGTAVLHFVMDRNGHVLSWSIRKSSGHKLLDRAVARLIKSADPMPALPEGTSMQTLSLTIPIRYRLH